jgi:predicted DCC family thiol-disulfide oxidoreductase YuxK
LERAAAVLLYDGACGLCQASVQVIVRRDRRRTLSFAPLDGRTALALRQRHPFLDHVDSLVWVDAPGEDGTERVHVRSAAVLRAAAYLGGGWSLLTLGWIVPERLRDAAYDLVARHRHRLFATTVCDPIPASVRSRFLE